MHKYMLTMSNEIKFIFTLVLETGTYVNVFMVCILI